MVVCLNIYNEKGKSFKEDIATTNINENLKANEKEKFENLFSKLFMTLICHHKT